MIDFEKFIGLVTIQYYFDSSVDSAQNEFLLE